MKIAGRVSLIVVIQSETRFIVRVAQENCRLYSALYQANFTWTSSSSWLFLNRRAIPRHSHLRNGPFLYRYTPLLLLNRLWLLPQFLTPPFLHSLITLRNNLLLPYLNVGGRALHAPIPITSLIFRSNRIIHPPSRSWTNTLTAFMGFRQMPIFGW